MRALLFGTYDTSMHPRITTIAEGLRAHGMDVAECNAPLGLDTAARVDMLAHPWRAPALLVRLARRWATLARTASRMPVPDVVLVGYLGHFDVHLARLIFRRVPVVLDHLTGASDTARDRRLGGIARQILLKTIDAAALRAADIVDTEEHLARLPARHRVRAVVVPVGAPSAWHLAARPPEPEDAEQDADDGPLRVVFYGLYTPLQGAPVIGAALSRIAGAPIEVTMVGDGQDKAATMAAAGSSETVRWLDWVPAAELPALVASHDVCLGIFGTGDKALRVVPNKVFQGAAAGCAVVTSDTAPQRRVLAGAGILVPPGDPDALAAALLRLAGDRGELARLRVQARALAEKQFIPERIVVPLTDKLAAAAGITSAAHSLNEVTGMVWSTTAAKARADVSAAAPLTPNAWLRYELIKRILPAGISDVLEVGCGQGALGTRLAQRYRYLGVEPDRVSWAVASARIGAAGGEVRNIALEDLGDEQFDLVCAFEVLEHIEDDAAALKEWSSRLRANGWLLLSVPAHQHRFGPADEMAGHFRRYDPAAMTALLTQCGFTEIQVRQYGFPLGYVLEAGRNQVGRRRLAAGRGTSVAERTAGSGRLLQPSGALQGAITRWGTAPFRFIERAFPNTGTGLVVLARSGASQDPEGPAG
jgi:glycosyltransferase involved in cell wall biosynthesis/2-polyprenyl-3-methyl-5-hydroxy-6-metoxy-1,4-benzoquinol methylase